jgi:hypothetical protein
VPFPGTGTTVSVTLTRVPFGDDNRPYWQRLYGLGIRWNKRAVDNYVTFVGLVVAAIVVVFAVLYVAIWLTS